MTDRAKPVHKHMAAARAHAEALKARQDAAQAHADAWLATTARQAAETPADPETKE